jgi:hypothetical protein
MSGTRINKWPHSCEIDSRSVVAAQTPNVSAWRKMSSEKEAQTRPVGVRPDRCDLNAQLSLSRLTHEDDRHVFLQHILAQLQQVSKQCTDRSVR